MFRGTPRLYTASWTTKGKGSIPISSRCSACPSGPLPSLSGCALLPAWLGLGGVGRYLAARLFPWMFPDAAVVATQPFPLDIPRDEHGTADKDALGPALSRSSVRGSQSASSPIRTTSGSWIRMRPHTKTPQPSSRRSSKSFREFRSDMSAAQYVNDRMRRSARGAGTARSAGELAGDDPGVRIDPE